MSGHTIFRSLAYLEILFVMIWILDCILLSHIIISSNIINLDGRIQVLFQLLWKCNLMHLLSSYFVISVVLWCIKGYHKPQAGESYTSILSLLLYTSGNYFLETGPGLWKIYLYHIIWFGVKINFIFYWNFIFYYSYCPDQP